MKYASSIPVCVFLLALLAPRVSGQESTRIRLDFQPDQFEVVQSESGMIRVEPAGDSYYYPSAPGQPALPLRSLNIRVPPGSELSGFTFETSEIPLAAQVRLQSAPRQAPTYLSAAGTGNALPQAGPAYGPLPEPVTFDSKSVQQGQTLFRFTLCPFRYSHSGRELRLIRSLDLIVTYRRGTAPPSIQTGDPAVSELTEAVSEDPWDLEPESRSLRQTSSKGGPGTVDYLIITADSLKDAFSPLLEWKTRKGLRAGLLTVEEILAGYTGNSPALKIKSCLYDYYVNRGLTWVLLAGDDRVVPVQYCTGKVYLSGNEIIDHFIPTDLFYACFDHRFDWDSNENGRVGEIYIDGNDLLPEIYLTRIPVRTAADAQTVVRKTIAYEMSPPATGFAGRVLLSGVKSWSSWEGKSDNHHRSEYMFHRHITREWPGTKVGFYDTGSDLDGSPDLPLTASNLSESLDEGYGIVHYAGHGNAFSLLMETGPTYHSDDAWAQTNSGQGLVLSTTCDISAFDSTERCLGESFLLNRSGGSVAFFGSTRYGFSLVGKSSQLGSSFRYNAAFLEYLFRGDESLHGNSFGKIAALSKARLVHNSESGGVYQYLQYALNAMGDPELPLYSGTPKRFEGIRIYTSGGALHVHTGGVEGSTICLTSLDLEEGYQEVVRSVPYHRFPDPPANFQVTVTRPGYVPYVYRSATVNAQGSGFSPQVRLFPNPATERFFVEIQEHEGVLELFDAGGRSILRQILIPGRNEIVSGALPAGVYPVRVTTPDGIAFRRVLIR